MKNMVYVTVYCDTTSYYTEEEMFKDNLCEILVPEDMLTEWVWLTDSRENHPDQMDVWFDDWMNEYTADETDGLFGWLAERYDYTAPNPKLESATVGN